MTLIEIAINLRDSNFKSVHIRINDQLVDYVIVNNIIKIVCDLDHGIHQLRMCLDDGSRIAIDDVVINSCGLRQTVYLSYIQTDTNEILQPASTLWDKKHEWILPFGLPVSFWLTLVTSKIGAGMLGKDLSKKYNIIYPSKIKLQTDCLPLVKDFFEHKRKIPIYYHKKK